jgi:hypothetical protein
MKLARYFASTWLACLIGPVLADEGLKVGVAGDFWSGTQTSIRLNAAMPSTAPLGLASLRGSSGSGHLPIGATLLGDYYFSSPPVDALNTRSGLRASSGLMFRQPGVSLSNLAWGSHTSTAFGMPARLSLPAGSSDLSTESFSTLSYVGFGYSGMSLKSGWGFWADVGLVAQSPGSALGLGRVLSGTQSLDDLLRELRLSPLVQVGVNYAF